VGQHDVGDRFAGDAFLGQLGHQLVGPAFEGEDAGLLLVPAVAHARVHEDAAPLRTVGQQAAQVQVDAVHLVGRVLLLPEDLGDDAEHGAAVELEASVVEGPEGPVADLHAVSAGRGPDPAARGPLAVSFAAGIPGAEASGWASTSRLR
jgi:hypothetical protein